MRWVGPPPRARRMTARWPDPSEFSEPSGGLQLKELPVLLDRVAETAIELGQRFRTL